MLLALALTRNAVRASPGVLGDCVARQSRDEQTMTARKSRPLIRCAVLLCCTAASACKPSGETGIEVIPGETRDPVTHLTAAEASEVLARVGSRTITLGEYALTLRRMAKFERLRYQTPDRQKQLLDEMIELELLAQEAERRGLDREPEVQLRLAQALRDEVLEDLRRSLPAPETLSEREVRDYYESHQNEFKEPERRRVLALVVATAALGRKLSGEAQGASGNAWGELCKKHSLERRGTGAEDALEWAGDFGFVSAPGEPRGQNPEIHPDVRAAVFGLSKLGDVAPAPVQVGSRFYVVRLGGTSPARDRSLRDADRTIRVELVRQKYLEKERSLEAELRKKFPIVIDEQALAAWKPEAPPSPPAPVAP